MGNIGVSNNINIIKSIHPKALCICILVRIGKYYIQLIEYCIIRLQLTVLAICHSYGASARLYETPVNCSYRVSQKVMATC